MLFFGGIFCNVPLNVIIGIIWVLCTHPYLFPIYADDLPIVCGEGDGQERRGHNSANGCEAQGHRTAKRHLISRLASNLYALDQVSDGVRAAIPLTSTS